MGMVKFELDDTDYFKKRDKEARKFQEFLDSIRKQDKEKEKN